MFTRKRLVIGSILLVVCVVVVTGWLFIRSLSQPASGVITAAPVSSSTASSSIDLTPHPRDGQTVSFSYPMALTVAKNSPFALPTVEEFNFTYRDIESWNIAIAVLYIPSQRINDNNAYLFRKVHPETYHESQQTVQGQPIKVMTDSSVGGFSKVGFLTHGNYQATVSVIGDDSDGTAVLQKTFNMILNSWRWKVN